MTLLMLRMLRFLQRQTARTTRPRLNAAPIAMSQGSFNSAPLMGGHITSTESVRRLG